MPVMYESTKKELQTKAEKARLNGEWFYHVKSKNWITPEEFVQLGEMDLIQYGEKSRITLDSYYAKDPREGIRDRVAYLKKASAELQEFNDKVIGYFNSVPKDRR